MRSSASSTCASLQLHRIGCSTTARRSRPAVNIPGAQSETDLLHDPLRLLNSGTSPPPRTVAPPVQAHATTWCAHRERQLDRHGALHPVKVATIVSPRAARSVPNSGSVLVNVTDSRSVRSLRRRAVGSGPGSFSGSAQRDGLRAVAQRAVGTYTMSVGGTAAGMVDQNGSAPANQPVSVVDQGTNTVNLQYDRPGSIQGPPSAPRDYSNGLVASSADSVIVSNTGMQVAKQFTPVGVAGGRHRSDDVDSLPFTSPYAVYAGTCASNTPPAGPMLEQLHGPRGGCRAR